MYCGPPALAIWAAGKPLFTDVLRAAGFSDLGGGKTAVYGCIAGRRL
jgi:hypothetical protein